jgi:hypothetical protein
MRKKLRKLSGIFYPMQLNLPCRGKYSFIGNEIKQRREKY